VNQDVVISLAMQAMSLALKVALPLLLAGLVVGLIVSIFQAVTQIQEMTSCVHPEDRGHRRRAGGCGPVDARADRQLHRAALRRDPGPGGTVNAASLLRHVSENQTAGFILVLARVSPLFLLAPIFSSRMVPARARGVAAVAIALGMAPLVLHNLKVPLDVGGLGGLVVK